jgi:hypothetical protein
MSTGESPGTLLKYEGIASVSSVGVALVAWVYAFSLRAFNPGPTSTGFGWPSGTSAGLSASDMITAEYIEYIEDQDLVRLPK